MSAPITPPWSSKASKSRGSGRTARSCGARKRAALTGARIEGPHRADRHLVSRLEETAAKYDFAAKAYEPARWLQDGDTVRFGEEQLQVLHCPGHVAYFSASRRQAFVGDILFRHTIGAWEHLDEDLTRLIRSIRLNLFSLGDDVGFVPGHGDNSTFRHERRENAFVSDRAYAN